MNEWVKLATLGKAHGLRGGLFLTGRDSLIQDSAKTFVVGPSTSSGKAVSLAWQGVIGSRFVAHFKEIKSRESAELYRDLELWGRRDELVVDELTEYLWADLIEKKVFDSENTFVGRIVNVCNYGASDIVEMQNDEDGKLAVPFVSAYFDLTFSSDADQIHMTVNSEIFSDAWE